MATIFETRLIGKIQIKNILMAMIAAVKSNISFKKITNTIKNLKPVSGRLEIIGRIKIKIFLFKLFEIYPSELSESIINPRPNKKIKYLYLLYLRFSFEVNINNKEINIKTGK